MTKSFEVPGRHTGGAAPLDDHEVELDELARLALRRERS
jgi:hypothetical protein